MRSRRCIFLLLARRDFSLLFSRSCELVSEVDVDPGRLAHAWQSLRGRPIRRRPRAHYCLIGRRTEALSRLAWRPEVTTPRSSPDLPLGTACGGSTNDRILLGSAACGGAVSLRSNRTPMRRQVCVIVQSRLIGSRIFMSQRLASYEPKKRLVCRMRTGAKQCTLAAWVLEIDFS